METSRGGAAAVEIPWRASTTWIFRGDPRSPPRATLSVAQAATVPAPANLLELYCGNGNHTAALAARFARVVAVEVDAKLVAAARRNLAANGATNAAAPRGSRPFGRSRPRTRLRVATPPPPRHRRDATAANLLPQRRRHETAAATSPPRDRRRDALAQATVLVDAVGKSRLVRSVLRRAAWTDRDAGEAVAFDCVLVDPPRCGLDADTLNQLAHFRHVLVVSCNPSALAQQAPTLAATHDVAACCMCDGFPGTPHVECLLHLVRR